MSYFCFLAWLLISSGLLTLTWNKVVAAMMKVKAAKYWQALLLVITLCVFCAPRYYMHKGCCGHHHSSCHKDKDCDGDGKKEDCPYSKHHGQQATEEQKD